LGNYGAAISDLNYAEQLQPGLADIFEARSIVYQRLGNPRLAREDKERAVRLRQQLGRSQDPATRVIPFDEYSDPEMDAFDAAEADLLWAVEDGEYFYDDGGEPHPPSDYW
jgi:tetratricopeptide (TPR) repeat protein